MNAKILSIYNALLQRALDSGIVPRLHVLKSLNHRIRSLLTPRKVVVDGHVMFLDRVDALGIARNRRYEPMETEVIRQAVKSGDRVVDLGANIGYFTLLCARLAGAGGSVIAVEPSPENFAILERNVAANGYANVTLWQKAVSDTEGIVRLYQPLRSGAQHSLAGDDPDDPHTHVETICLDKRIEGRVDFIKIDVEGAELNALRGARGLIERSGELTMMTEFNPRALSGFGTDPADYLRLLAELGFTCRNIDRNAGTVVPCTAAELLERYTAANGRYTNLLCVRGDR